MSTTVNKDLNIHVHHVTRVEGHGDIKIRMKNGQLEQCDLQIVESPRFFESMVMGRRWKDVHHITCRICGICSVGHTTASLGATEAAFGLELTPQGRLLRELILHGEQLQSHILHVYFLAAPDLLDVGSVVPLASSHPDVVKRALRLKKFANYVCEIVAGRHVHPISMWPGGFKHVPTKAQLQGLKRQLQEEVVPDLVETVNLIAQLAPKLPAFERSNDVYMALTDPDRYAWFTGELTVANGKQTKVKMADYGQLITETVKEDTTVKHCFTNGASFHVGARARVNMNFDQLTPMAKNVAATLGYEAPCSNPFMNNVAQVVECAHCAEDAIGVIDQLLDMPLAYEEPVVNVKAGRGVGIAEVPRGTLVHDYTYDADGNAVDCNLIIPTTMNIENVEQDMRELLPQIIDRPKEEITHILEMLVRAYDPCISCSVHMLNVEFV